VSGPESSTDNNFALYSGESGKLIKDTGVKAADFATASHNHDGTYNNYTHPNHSGDVTSVADGATTIANGAVTLAKQANLAANTIIGRVTASTGVPEALTAANVRTIINVADGATANAKISGSTLDSLSDDTGFVTAKAIQDGKNVPHAAPGTSGNLLISNGTDWTSGANTNLPLAGGTMTGALEAADHGTASTDQVINVCYGTGDPPTASTTTEGALFIKYTA
jgi:hypothetical protein